MFVGIFQFYALENENCRIFPVKRAICLQILKWAALEKLVHNFRTYPDFLDRSWSLSENVYKYVVLFWHITN